MTDASNSQYTAIGSNLNLAEGATATVGAITVNFNDLTSQRLVTTAKEILLALTRHEYKTAENYLAALKSVNTTNDDCRAFIQVLEYKFKLSQEIPIAIDTNLFFQLFRSPTSDDVIKDIVESIYIHFLLKSSEDDARNRYADSQYKNSYCKEVYFSFLASEVELQQEINAGTTNLYEHELCSLVRCTLRHQNFDLADELSTKLLKQSPNNNSELLNFFASVLKLNQEVKGRHLWGLPRPIQKELLQQIDNCLSLIGKNEDKRVIHIATALLVMTGFSHPKIAEFCQQHISEASKVCPDIELILSELHSKTENKLIQSDILKKKTLDEDDFIALGSAFFAGDLKGNKIKSWLDDGVEIELTQPNETNERFMKIVLHAISCTDSDFERKQQISKLLDVFIGNDIEQIHQFNIPLLHHLCTQLNKLGEHVYVIKLLEKLIPDNPGASPIVDEYARALLRADQLNRLKELLTSINDDEKSYALLVVEIHRACLLDERTVCIEKNRFALTKYPNACYLWWLLLHNLHLFQSPREEIDAVVDAIPKDILKSYSVHGLNLLNVIALSDIALTQALMLEWFIDDPVVMAQSITNLLLVNIGQKQPWSTKYKSARCTSAVIYLVDGKTQTRLLVEDCTTNEYLINIDTTLGKCLESTAVGDTFDLGVKTYTIKEKLPPIVGAFRISTDIRQEINTGNDCFYQLSIQEDNIDDLFRLLDKIDKQPHVVNPEVNGLAIPLLLRLINSHANDMVRGCFYYLTDVNSNKSFYLYDQGTDVEQSVVLDVLSLTYLSLTGFCHGLIAGGKRLFITRETKNIVMDWLRKVGSPEFLSMSKVGDTYVRATAADVQNHPFYNNLNLLINSCSLLVPRQIDMPESITKIKEHVDISHYSTIQASISHSIPILCLDPLMCSLYKTENLDLINVFGFMHDVSSLTPDKDNFAVELFIGCKLQVPVLNRNIFWLCTQKNHSQNLAAKIISQPLANYPNPDAALLFLSQCCSWAVHSYFRSSFFDFWFAEFDWQYTEDIIYACCSSAIEHLKGDTREARFALFALTVLEQSVKAVDLLQFITNCFYNFAHGHFLDIAKINNEIKVLQELS